ncbi:MAG: tRNA threonylcarbamoyladenosine dehydratase [Clostridia bacterium]|nr:tRNA threonylcarbamoyladenosine dehydratase [Clostridia bacterium]
MEERFLRTSYVIGDDAVERIKKSAVIIFGVGGVGSYCAEALARLGVGKITLVDSDVVSESNINRQIIALHSTVGQPKVDVMKKRILDVNPDCEVEAVKAFYMPDNSGDFDLSKYDCVVDAVDTVSAKIELCVKANEAGVPIISSMGTGNKLDPTKLECTDVYKTSVCPLARVMRAELRRRGIKSLKVVYSTEAPIPRHADHASDDAGARKVPPGSVSFVPGAAGLILAKEVFDVIQNK